MMNMADGEEMIEADTLSCCASCCITEIDDIKLVPCDGCDLVKYCSDACQEDHKSEHEEDCKKRAAELRDELLFKQPECSHLGDCPICTLPLSLDQLKSTMMACCSKVICLGCWYANRNRQIEQRRELSCPFCREPIPENDEEYETRRMKRAEANDPIAMSYEGIQQNNEGNYRSAFEYLTKAAELGESCAHYHLACLYHGGEGVEKDKGKEVFHWEKAAIAGHPVARHNLGVHEWNSRNIERAVKHWIIAATQGDDDSIKKLMEGFKKGYVEKEELAVALRAHHAAVDATKSPQMEAVENL